MIRYEFAVYIMQLVDVYRHTQYMQELEVCSMEKEGKIRFDERQLMLRHTVVES